MVEKARNDLADLQDRLGGMGSCHELFNPFKDVEINFFSTYLVNSSMLSFNVGISNLSFI